MGITVSTDGKPASRAEYSAPRCTVYGRVVDLTASGSRNSREDNGGTCGPLGSANKVRC